MLVAISTDVSENAYEASSFYRRRTQRLSTVSEWAISSSGDCGHENGLSLLSGRREVTAFRVWGVFTSTLGRLNSATRVGRILG